jgi:primase-polymerase (primpol)-like protein
VTIAGAPASSTDPGTWSTHAEAEASSAGVGVGFVLNGDGIVCIDLDHCVDNGRVSAAVAAFLASLPRTFVEASPSGTGLHVWGYGAVRRGRRIVRDGLNIEVYGTGRYITVTGKPVVRAPFADLSGALASIL